MSFTKIHLKFPKFEKTYQVLGWKDNAALVVERSPAVLEAIGRDPKAFVVVTDESGERQGIGRVINNTSPMEISIVFSEKITENSEIKSKQGTKPRPSSKKVE